MLQHLELCRAGLAADCAATAAAAQDTVASGGSAANGDASDGGSTADTNASGGSTAGASSCYSPSFWAMPLELTLHALANLWADADHITDASATAAARGFVLLATHELATEQPLPWRADNAPVDSEGGYMALEALTKLKGAPSLTVHGSLLQQLASDLAAATADMAIAYPAGAPASCDARATSESCTPEPRPAAAAAAAAQPDDPAVLPPSPDLAVPAQESRPSPAAARSGPVAIEDVKNLAVVIRSFNRTCLERKDLQLLLPPASELGQAWAAAVADALATCCFRPEALWPYLLDLPDAALRAVYWAACELCATATTLLRRFAWAGLDALQQAAGVQLLEALTAHLSSDADVALFAHEVCTLQ